MAVDDDGRFAGCRKLRRGLHTTPGWGVPGGRTSLERTRLSQHVHNGCWSEDLSPASYGQARRLRDADTGESSQTRERALLEP